MIRVVSDPEQIAPVLRDPFIWDHISDDYSGNAADFVPPVTPDRVYLGAFDGEALVGVFLYHFHTRTMAEVHSCILRSHRGRWALDQAKASLRFIFDNTTCRKVITHVPDYNKPALSFALRVGMTLEGNNRASFLKNGVLHDQALLGIRSDEACL